MEQDLEKDYKPIIAGLRAYAETVSDAETKNLLLEASNDLEALSDFSLNLVDVDGTLIYTIPDAQVKKIMVRAVDDFIQSAISSREIPIPEEKTLTYEEAEEFEKQFKNNFEQ